MALVTSQEMERTVTLPAPNEIGKLYQHDFVIDTTATALAVGDFVQLGYKPACVIITEVIVSSDVSAGTTTLTLGIADALVTTAIDIEIAPASAADDSITPVFGDTAIDAPNGDEGLLVLEVGVEAEAAAVMTVRVTYKAA